MSASVADSLAVVNQRIAEAAARAGRSRDDITLVAVSKTKSWELVAQAIAAGQCDFGENTIQDALTKIPNTQTNPAIRWHFIGRLQSNKTKHLPGNFHWVHTLDSIKLIRRLESACGELGATLDGLVQVNTARDPAKAGLMPEQLEGFLEEAVSLDLSHLRLRGLMTIGSLEAAESQRRKEFADLRELLSNTASDLGLSGFDQLSMGMSDDFEWAVEEGATLVRVGSTIFGERG